jgi:polysaccharide biosynthesis protein PslH
MRVLFVTRQFPWPRNSGGSQRIFHFVRGLSRRHRVTLLTLIRQPVTQEELDSLRTAAGCEEVLTFDGNDCGGDNSVYWGNPVTFTRRVISSRFPILIYDWWSETLSRELIKFFNDKSFDLVVTRDPSFAEQARATGFPRIILDVDDLFSMILRQQLSSSRAYRRKMLHRIDAAKARMYERSLPTRFERIVLAKTDDLRFFPDRVRGKLAVIPNGVSLPPALPKGAEVPNRLLFVGTLSYGPNVDAVCYLAREVLPLLWKECPDVTVDIVGRGPADPDVLASVTDPRCRIHESPPDLTAFYREAAVVVAPIRQGSGTRIKVLEALAYEKALIATSFAPEGLGLDTGTHFIAADSPSAFARACRDLLADAPRRRTLGAAGREFVARNFDWERIEERIGALADGPPT